MSRRMATRFGTTVVASVLRGALSLATTLLLVRGLGVSGYGDLTFLLASFAAIGQWVELETSSAFYTFLSRRPRGRRFFLYYVSWLALQGAITLALVGVVLPDSLRGRLWIGQPRSLIIAACVANFLMTQVWGMVSQVGEAARRTILVQVSIVAQTLVHVAGILVALWLGRLNPHVVLWLIAAEYGAMALWLGPRLIATHLAEAPVEESSGRAVLGEFLTYCRPLMIYATVGFAYSFADRWLLQRFGGSAQQGVFAVARQCSMVGLMLSTSMIRVFWKELAEAQEQDDHARIEFLYLSTTHALFLASAWLAGLLAPYSREIVRLTLGPGYDTAWICLAWMLLVPVHQALGQLRGTYFYATGQTSAYTRLNLSIMLVSLPITYLLLAPPNARLPGLGLGAAGLAFKTFALQVLGISIQGVIIARQHGWSDSQWRQLALMMGLVAWGAACRWLAAETLDVVGLHGPIPLVVFGAALYVLGTLLVVRRKPALAGVPKEQLAQIARSVPGGRWLGLLAGLRPEPQT